MADDDFPQRPQRASQPPLRSAPATAPQSAPGNDPLAELARLIGQTDPFAEYGREGGQQAAAPAGKAPAHEAAAAPGFGETRFAATQPAPAVPPQFGAPDFTETPYPADAYAEGPVPGYGAEPGQPGFDQGPFYPNIPHDAAEEEHFYDEVQPRRRVGVLAAAAVFALVVVGVAGAFGYRALFGTSAPSGPPPVIKADTTPSKVVPAQSKDAKSGKLIYDRVANGPQDEKLVSREEQPVDIGKDKPVGAVFPQGPGGTASGTIEPAAMGSGVVGVEPKKIHTIAIHPDQMASGAPEPPAAAMPASKPAPKPAPMQAQAPVQAAPKLAQASPPPDRAARAEPPVQHAAAPSNAPLSLNPDAPAPAPVPARTAPRPRATPAPTQIAPARVAAPAPIAPAASAGAGGYAVQVASRRSEADAQASLRSLQAKYPQQLGSQSPLIRRVDLGAKGVYYRAMVGPFGSAEQASQVCSSLKAAGGDCLIQKI